jgi:hypothetical protein
MGYIMLNGQDDIWAIFYFLYCLCKDSLTGMPDISHGL